MNSDAEYRNMETSDVPDDDVDDHIDEEDIELYDIDLYQGLDLEADIDPDYRDAWKMPTAT